VTESLITVKNGKPSHNWTLWDLDDEVDRRDAESLEDGWAPGETGDYLDDDACRGDWRSRRADDPEAGD
jgi:hypothetical protein